MLIGVTGGAGYIGSHVVAELLDLGHQVVVIDNMILGNSQNRFDKHSNYTFIQGHIESQSDLDRFFSHAPEIIFHFAAYKAAGESMQNPEKYSANNIRGSFYLVEKMLEYGCKNIVFSSTAAVYGDPQYLPIDEQHPIDPVNYYGFSKHSIEKNLEWMSEIHGIRYALLRYFNAAGYDLRQRICGLEKQPQNLIPVVMEVALGIREKLLVFGNDFDTPDGTGIRDYIHVNDLSSAHLTAMEYILKKQKSLLVNIGTGTGLSVMNIIEAAKKITKRDIPYSIVPRRKGDPHKVVASSKKAGQLLDWKCQHSHVDTIIESTWQVYEKSQVP